MKGDIRHKISTVVTLAASIGLSWGGMLYAMSDPGNFKGVGMFAALVGYGFCFRAVRRYETYPDDRS